MKIYKCGNCGRYTLEILCPKCGSPAVDPKPAKFSPVDPYGKYRRMAKRSD